MKLKLLIISVCFIPSLMYSQNFNDEKISLTNFIIRMYNNNPFEGVKIIEDYKNEYILSVVTLKKSNYETESVMNRVASVKASRQISTYLNGSINSSELIIITDKTTLDSIQKTQIIETIKEKSIGFVNQLELLQTIDTDNGLNKTYLYYKKIK